MKYKLQDLIDIEHFQLLQNRLNDIYSFPSAIIDNEGNILTATEWQDICTKFHRVNRESAEECKRSDQYILSHLHEADPAVSYLCPHGLIDNATPIIIEGVHYGNFFTGQFFLEEPDMDFFREQAKRYGFDEAAYLEAVKKVPVWTQEQLNNYLFFIKGLIEVISGIGLRNLREAETRKQIKEKEEQAQTILSQMFDGYWVMDIQGHLLDVNDAFCRMVGYSRDEVLQMTVPELSANDPTIVAEKIRGIIRNGSAIFESRLRHKNGSTIIADVAARYLPDRNIVIGFHRDVTERRKAEADLKAREKQLAESQRIAHIGSWEYNLTTGQIFWSDELFRILGLDPAADKADFNMLLEMIHPDDRPALKKVVDETVRLSRPFSIDHRVILRNGTTKVLHAEGEIIRGESQKQITLSGTAQDITSWKQQEQALVESEASYRNLFDSSTDGIFILDLDGNIIDANKTAYERLGYTREELLSLHISKLNHPNFNAQLPERLKRIRQQGVAIFESGHLRKDGSLMPVEVNSRLLEHKGKQVYFSVIRDITERKSTQEKLRQSEKFVRNILDTVDEGFIVIDRDYRIVTANKAYCSQVGCRDDNIIGRPCYEVSHKIGRPCFEEGEDCAVRRVFETGEPQAAFHRHKDREDNILYVETKAYPLRDASGQITSAIETVNNITAKLLLEEERLKTQKLESIGTLAGGIAHDFNNLLQGIFGYISMAKMSLDRPERIRSMLRQAEEALHLAVNLTTQLLTFSKGGRPIKRLIALEPVIENAVKFALSGSHTGYVLDMAPDLRPVEADEGQLTQVIQNIVINANDAMAGRGTVSISAANADIAGGAISGLPEGGRFVRIAIQDSGTGIQQKNLDRIFDPYFTTKQRGSGLGLATSYSIIRNHGGIIVVSSEVNRGSTFTIYLPASTDTAIAEKAAAPETVSVRKGRILLMDDEELVRDVAKEMIGALGHEAQCAPDGETAIGMYVRARESGTPFDVVILDLTVRGGMGGEETVRRLREIDPDVIAVVSSGYADNTVVADFRAYGFSAVLNKPYRISALRDCLNALIVQSNAEGK
ncbi:MAG: PAS domain S-box protein [Nitrospirae bacterium]|nr:PAS domain S-box protein [Nitrospirota bacterium]